LRCWRSFRPSGFRITFRSMCRILRQRGVKKRTG